MPDLLERAISEINELRPDIVICSGDLTTFGFKEEYAQAKRYLDRLECESFVVIPGNHDSRNVGYVHFEQLFGDRNSVLRKNGVTSSPSTRPSPTSTTATSAAAATRWIEEQFAGAGRPAHLRPAPPSAAGPGHGPRAQHRLRRRRRDRVPAARRASTSSSPGTSTCRMRGGSRTSSSSTRARSPRCACAATTRPCYNVIEVSGTHVAVWRRYPFHGQERIIQFDPRRWRTRSTPARIEDEVTPRLNARRAHRRRALPAGRARRDRRAAVRVGRRRSSSAGREKLRGGEDYGVPLASTRLRRRASSSSTSPTSPCSGPASASARASRALAAGFPYVGSDFRFDPPRLAPLRAAVDRRDRDREARREDRASPATSRACSRASTTSSSWRWAAAGPPEPEVVERRADARRPARALALGAATPPRTTSRSPRSPACRRSAAAAPAAGWRGRSSSRTCSRVRASPPSAARPRRLRRERRRAPAGRDDRRVLVVGRTATTRRRVPQRLPDPRLRPRRPVNCRGRGRDHRHPPAAPARAARGRASPSSPRGAGRRRRISTAEVVHASPHLSQPRRAAGRPRARSRPTCTSSS